MARVCSPTRLRSRTTQANTLMATTATTASAARERSRFHQGGLFYGDDIAGRPQQDPKRRGSQDSLSQRHLLCGDLHGTDFSNANRTASLRCGAASPVMVLGRTPANSVFPERMASVGSTPVWSSPTNLCPT